VDEDVAACVGDAVVATPGGRRWASLIA